ncbi:MAG: ferritin, partial [Phenylobacterium sp.]|nr:ferritin [Phenylobacterium sp.]
MLHVTVVDGPPTEVQTFDSEDLAARLSDRDVEVIREIFNTPLTGSYNWDYETANSKIRRLYELGKRFNWNTELDLAWTQAPPPPREVGAGEGPEGFAGHPKWEALTPEQKREFSHRSN